MSVNFDFSQLSSFEVKVVNMLNQQSRESRQLMNTLGSGLAREIRKVARKKTKMKTGNLRKGIRKGKAYYYNKERSFEVRVHEYAPHAHLVEYGHKMLTKLKKPVKNGYSFVRGKGFIKDAEKTYETAFVKDVDKFVDKILKKGFG